LTEGRGFGDSSLTVYWTVSAHHPRSRAIVASSFAVGFSSPGAAFREAAARAEMPGFFALAAEAPTLRATCRHRGDVGVASSLRPSAGGANGEAMPRARAVTPRSGPAVS